MPSKIERAVVKGSLWSVVSTRNMFIAEVDAFLPADTQVLWSDYLQGIYDAIRNVMASSWTIGSYQVEEMIGGHWFPVEEVNFTYSGGSGSQQAPNSVAAVFLGKIAYSRAFSRKWFSGLAKDSLTGNSLAAAAITAFAIALTAYVNPIIDPAHGNLTPGMVTKDKVFHPFAVGILSGLLGSMRRRKPGVGI